MEGGGGGKGGLKGKNHSGVRCLAVSTSTCRHAVKKHLASRAVFGIGTSDPSFIFMVLCSLLTNRSAVAGNEISKKKKHYFISKSHFSSIFAASQTDLISTLYFTEKMGVCVCVFFQM